MTQINQKNNQVDKTQTSENKNNVPTTSELRAALLKNNPATKTNNTTTRINRTTKEKQKNQDYSRFSS